MRLFSLVGFPLAAALPSRRAATIVEGPTLTEVSQVANLMRAWERVRANKGSAGGDGVTIESFSAKLVTEIADLSGRLRNGTYRSGRLRRVSIPKPDGRRRELAIPCIRDRVVQTAVLNALSPVVDPRMSDASWAYRPGRGVRDAIEDSERLFTLGYHWSVDADIASYFDRIPHDRLIDELTIWIDDPGLVGLIGRWLRSFSRSGVGIAQGAPISPLLANLYLHPVDRHLVAAGYPLVRYADDLIVLAKSKKGAEQALVLLRQLLKARRLSLNAAKTNIRSPDETFKFLGQEIGAQKIEPV